MTNDITQDDSEVFTDNQWIELSEFDDTIPDGEPITVEY